MAGEVAAFDKASRQFIDHYNQVRGRVRSKVTQHNLTSHLPSGFLEVLDYQGGNGRDTIWIAGLGDRSTLLEESSGMLKDAEINIKKEPASTRRRIEVIRGNIDNLPIHSLFDVILSHGVLMYELENPQGQLNALAAKLQERGVLSLLTKGREAARLQVPKSMADEFETTGVYTNRLGLPARAYSFDELESMISQAGMTPVARYGVRLISDDDKRLADELPESEWKDILADEIKASQNPAHMEQAQMLHIIAQK